MGTTRTKYLDQDNRRIPKTGFHCIACHKDLVPGRSYRWIHLINGGPFVLHPEDESTYIPDGGDLGHWPLGSDCARKLGHEWSYQGVDTLGQETAR